MVWIYRGGFNSGTGADDIAPSEPLCKRSVVLVTLNYRLNVFGFLAHSGLTAESPRHSSGNYGLLDQIAALKWVKANIAAFGGDPARVNIFGVSAGGSAVCRLIVSPLANGLFHRAIVESAGREFRPLKTLSEAETLGRFWGENITQMRAGQADDLKRKLTLVSGARVGPTDAPGFSGR